MHIAGEPADAAHHETELGLHPARDPVDRAPDRLGNGARRGLAIGVGSRVEVARAEGHAPTVGAAAHAVNRIGVDTATRWQQRRPRGRGARIDLAGYFGSPRMRSPMMPFWISVVPPAMPKRSANSAWKAQRPSSIARSLPAQSW